MLKMAKNWDFIESADKDYTRSSYKMALTCITGNCKGSVVSLHYNYMALPIIQYPTFQIYMKNNRKLAFSQL